MALNITRTDLWAAGIGDHPGTLAEKLAALSNSGANFEFVFARRAPETPGAGVVFLTPLKGAAQIRAAKAQGFQRLRRIASVRVEGPDKPGLAAAVARKVAESGINLRGFSATVNGRCCIIYLALDCSADAAKVVRALKRN